MSIPEEYSQCRDWLLRCVAETHQVTSITGFHYGVDLHWRRISSRVCLAAVEWMVGNIPDLPRPSTLDEATFVANYLRAVADVEGVANITDVSADLVVMRIPIMRCDEAGDLIDIDARHERGFYSPGAWLRDERKMRHELGWLLVYQHTEAGFSREGMALGCYVALLDGWPSGGFRTSAQCRCLR